MRFSRKKVNDCFEVKTNKITHYFLLNFSALYIIKILKYFIAHTHIRDYYTRLLFKLLKYENLITEKYYVENKYNIRIIHDIEQSLI